MADKKNKVVVTGGGGFIGSYICEEMLRRGFEVVALDTSSGAKVEHLMGRRGFRFVQGSVTDVDALEHELQGAKMVFHLAAIADPKQYVANPLSVLQVDLKASIDLFRIAAMNRTKVIFSSTSEIYGVNPKVPWNEDAQRVLGSTHINRWCYSTAKAACEHYLYAHHLEDGLPFVIYRFFNIYGPKLDDLGHGRVMTMFLKNLLEGAPIEIHGDGKQTRSFLYVTDAVDAIVRLALLKKAENQVFNIGSGEETSILDLAKLMKRAGRFDSPLKLISYRKAFGASYEDIPRRCPDISKLRATIAWRPKVSLTEGVHRTIEYYRRRAGLSL